MNNVFNISGDSLYLNYATPEAYGAVGDGMTDDTLSVQMAVSNGGFVLFNSNKTYKIDGILRIPKNTYLDLNGSTIIGYNSKLRVIYNFEDSDDTVTGYNGNGNIVISNGVIERNAMAFIHGSDIFLQNLRFKNCHNDHFIEIAGCKNFIVNNCSFVGMDNNGVSVHEYINVDPCTRTAFPHFSDPSAATYDGTKNDGIVINDCYFSIGEGEFNTGFNAFGVHGAVGDGKHKNIRLTGNTLRGFTGCGFRLNDMEGIHVADNDIQVVGDGIRIGDVSDGNCEDIVIRHNYIVSSSGQKIVKTSGRYTDLTVSGNVTEGDTQEF